MTENTPTGFFFVLFFCDSSDVIIATLYICKKVHFEFLKLQYSELIANPGKV